MRRWVLSAVVLSLVVLGAVSWADDDPPADAVEQVWRAKAELQFELQPLLDQGLMPIVNRAPAPDGGGWPTPQLTLFDLNEGKARWTLPTDTEVTSMTASESIIFLATAGLPGQKAPLVGACQVSDGTLLWQQALNASPDCGGDLTPVFRQIRWFGDRWALSQGIGGGVVIEADRVFLKIGNDAFCLNARTGEPIWQTPVGFTLATPLTPCGKLLLAPIRFQGLMALDKETGAVAWSTPIDKISRVYALGDRIYCGTNDGYFGRLDPVTGDVMWQVEGASTFIQAAIPVGEKVVLRVPDTVWILDAATGATDLKVTTSGDGSTISDDSLFYTPPAAQGEAVQLVAVSVADSQEKWRADVDGVPSCLRWAGGNVIALQPMHAFGYDPNDGHRVWEFHPQGASGFIDADTVAGEDSTVWFHTAEQLIGFNTKSGACLLEASGKFFHVNWMRQRSGNLCFFDGMPGDTSLTSVKLVHTEQ
jgi:outer membrane protein assembly factor BamB